LDELDEAATTRHSIKHQSVKIVRKQTKKSVLAMDPEWLAQVERDMARLGGKRRGRGPGPSLALALLWSLHFQHALNLSAFVCCT